MRLIDVDELKKRATKVMFRDAPECGEFDAVAVDDIDCMPTIDPESLRPTAKWSLGRIEDHIVMNFICGNCGARSELNYKYCPKCGARMIKNDKGW